MNKKQGTGKDLRTQLERRVEIQRSLTDICEDFMMRPEVPVNLWRLIIRDKGLRPRLIPSQPVEKLHDVYSLCGAPLIVFSGEGQGQRFMSFLHKGSLLGSFLGKFPHTFMVGKDGTAVFSLSPGQEWSDDKSCQFYNIWPNPEYPGAKPFLVVNNDEERVAFIDKFFKNHGRESPWGRDGMLICGDKNDSILQNHGDLEAEFVSGSIGDCQIGIARCGQRLYQVILGWSEDFKKPTE